MLPGPRVALQHPHDLQRQPQRPARRDPPEDRPRDVAHLVEPVAQGRDAGDLVEVPQEQPVGPGGVDGGRVHAPDDQRRVGQHEQRPQRLVELAGRHRAEQVQRAQQHQVGPAVEHGRVVRRERRAVDLGDAALRVRAAELLAQQRALADAGLADQQVVAALPDARRHLLAGPVERREQLAVGPDAGLRVLAAVVAAQVLGVVAAGRRGDVGALPARRLGQARRGDGPGGEQRADRLAAQQHRLQRDVGAARRRQVDVAVPVLVQREARVQEVAQRAQVGAVELAGGGVGEHGVPVGGQRPIGPVAVLAQPGQQRADLPVGLAREVLGDLRGQHAGQGELQRPGRRPVAHHRDRAHHAVGVRDRGRRLGKAGEGGGIVLGARQRRGLAGRERDAAAVVPIAASPYP
jgi:hypothetical protein